MNLFGTDFGIGYITEIENPKLKPIVEIIWRTTK